MRITRRGLFAAIAAAVVGKPAVKGVSLALMRAYDPRPRKIGETLYIKKPMRWGDPEIDRQYRNGALNFHRDCFAFEWYPVPNSVLTKDEITHKSLMILQTQAVINPES